MQRLLSADEIKGLMVYEPYYPDPSNDPDEILDRDAAVVAVESMEQAFPLIRNALVAHKDDAARHAIVAFMAGLAVLGDALTENADHAKFQERAKTVVANWAN